MKIENPTQTINVNAKEVKSAKKPFLSFSSNVNGKWYKIKFTADCNDRPRKAGIFQVTFNLYDCFIGEEEPYINKDGKQITPESIVITHVESVSELDDNAYKNLKLLRLAKIFGTEVSEPETTKDNNGE